MNNLEYLKPSLRQKQKRRDKRLDEELIECYRRGTRSKQMKGYNNTFLRNNFEHARQYESIRFKHGGGTKHFNDNLEPMMRFLNSKVGKNWNKVHSELCTQLSKKTVPGLHVFNHLYDFVFEKTITEGNKIFHIKFSRYEELVSREKWPKFYVNKKTGQLMKVKNTKRNKRKIL